MTATDDCAFWHGPTITTEEQRTLDYIQDQRLENSGLFGKGKHNENAREKGKDHAGHSKRDLVVEVLIVSLSMSFQLNRKRRAPVVA